MKGESSFYFLVTSFRCAIRSERR